MPDSLSKRQIRNIMRAEHKSSGITKINPGLYRALNHYLQRLQEAYLEAHAENKTQKALTLTKEIRDTERDVSTIYELRERKILLMAQDIVRGGAPSLKYLFPEEKLLLLRLSSILLAMRKDIRIDFHHRVDKYITTIAREYDLERKLNAMFHPTEPFCEEGDVSATSPVAEGVATPRAESPVPPSPRATVQGELLSKDGDGDGTEMMIPSEPPVQGDLQEFSSGATVEEEVEEEYERIAEEPGGADAGGSDLGVVEEGSDPFEGMEEGETEEEEEEEGEPVDFFTDYALAGTMDSIPQFRASDLHDYRFEKNEIISIPRKMAELLERQGKLFIIDLQ